eukprot:3716572-Pyramimonas_sp.AAC.1
MRGPPEPPSLDGLTVWPCAADDPRASPGPSQGDQRASRELHAALCPAPRPPPSSVCPAAGALPAISQPASSFCSALGPRASAGPLRVDRRASPGFRAAPRPRPRTLARAGKQ